MRNLLVACRCATFWLQIDERVSSACCGRCGRRRRGRRWAVVRSICVRGRFVRVARVLVAFVFAVLRSRHCLRGFGVSQSGEAGLVVVARSLRWCVRATTGFALGFSLRTPACLPRLARSALLRPPCLTRGTRSGALLLACDAGCAPCVETSLTHLCLLLVRHDVVLAWRQGSRMVGWLRLLALRDPRSDAQRESEEERLSALGEHQKTFGWGLDNGQDVPAAEAIHVRSRKRPLHGGTRTNRRWYPSCP